MVVEMRCRGRGTNRGDAVLRALPPDGAQARATQGRTLGVCDDVKSVVDRDGESRREEGQGR
jgi:hypothetical protein